MQTETIVQHATKHNFVGTAVYLLWLLFVLVFLFLMWTENVFDFLLLFLLAHLTYLWVGYIKTTLVFIILFGLLWFCLAYLWVVYTCWWGWAPHPPLSSLSCFVWGFEWADSSDQFWLKITTVWGGGSSVVIHIHQFKSPVNIKASSKFS